MRSLDKRRDDTFTPDIPPTDPEALPTWIFNQVSNLAKSISNVNSIHVEKITHWEEGYKPREGDIIQATEGLLFEGSDAGLYVYMDGEWIPFAGSAVGGTIPIGGIIIWTGSSIPEGWALCDGNNAPNGVSTPDLQDRFIKGAGSVAVGTSGGSTKTGSHAITEAQMPSHNHSGPSHVHSGPSHTHTQQGSFGANTGGAGSHNHGISGSVCTASARHSAGTVGSNNRDFVETMTGYSNEGNHQHSVTTTISGETGHAGTGNTGSGGTGNTGNKGSSGGHEHTLDPVYYAVAYIMRYA